MIVLDTNALVGLLVPEQNDNSLRLRGLVTSSVDKREPIGIPAPVFAEFLAGADEAKAALLEMFDGKAFLQVLPFDRRAAHECALLDRQALLARRRKDATSAPRQKAKVDRQIIAIAKVCGARQVISNDANVLSIGRLVGLQVTTIESLPIPDNLKQLRIPFETPSDTSGESPNKSADPPDKA